MIPIFHFLNLNSCRVTGLQPNRAPGPDGSTYERSRVDDDTLRRAFVSVLELVHHWAVVPSVWRSAGVRLSHKTGAEDGFTSYRHISLALLWVGGRFERRLLKRVLPHVNRALMRAKLVSDGVLKPIFYLR